MSPVGGGVRPGPTDPLEPPAALLRRLEELEGARLAFLEAVRALPPAALDWRPSPESWTPAQVVQHLCLVEELTLQQVDAPLAPGVSRATLRTRVGALVVRVVLSLGIRVRMPTRRVAPEPPLPFEESSRRWMEAAAALRERLPSLAARSGPVMFHPVAGPRTLPQALDFLLAHLQHHRRQLDRITGSPGFPGRPPPS